MRKWGPMAPGSQPPSMPITDTQLARGLGWATLGIAAAELFATEAVEHLLGVDHHTALIRGFGLRELAAGLTILTQDQVTPTLTAGIWARVAGDVVDGVALAAAAPKTRNPVGFAVASTLVAGIVALDVWAAVRLTKRSSAPSGVERFRGARVIPAAVG